MSIHVLCDNINDNDDDVDDDDDDDYVSVDNRLNDSSDYYNHLARTPWLGQRWAIL